MSPEAWLTPDWTAPDTVHALTTLRTGPGHSVTPFHRFNMGNFATEQGDDPDAVMRNRAALLTLAQLPSYPFWLKQVHGAEVAQLRAREQLDTLPTADASFTRERGLVLAIQTADCLPVLFADDAGSVIGAAHAGWRSLVGGVLESTVTAMDVQASTLNAWLGPAAGPDKYEVGIDVYDAFVSRDWKAGSAFKTTREHHWNMDLYALARQRLVDIGLDPRKIRGGDQCTITDNSRYFSHRREQRTGRMASLIWMDA